MACVARVLSAIRTGVRGAAGKRYGVSTVSQVFIRLIAALIPCLCFVIPALVPVCTSRLDAIEPQGVPGAIRAAYVSRDGSGTQ